MSESTKAIASLKKAGNYMKLAMRKNGPRSFKRGQGALIKVIYKAGEGTLSKDDAKKALGWRGRDVRFVAKKAADNGYLTIDKPKNGFLMTLTDLGCEVIKKRLEAEDKVADEILAGLSDEEKAALIAKDPRYGRIICRCETITEGEILAALHSEVPATTIDGVKRRAGAGMGRCQGGFCGPRVLELISRELGIDPLDILQDKNGSNVLLSETKVGGKNNG